MGKSMLIQRVWMVPLSLVLIQPALAIGDIESRLKTDGKLERVLVAAQENQHTEKERADAPDTLFLSLNGIRYEAIQWGKARGLEQNGGYVAALNEKTGKQKWLVQVYKVRYEHDKEEDKQDVFIRKIALGENKRTLLIENDRGEHYILDLRTLSVKSQFRSK